MSSDRRLEQLGLCTLYAMDMVLKLHLPMQPRVVPVVAFILQVKYY